MRSPIAGLCGGRTVAGVWCGTVWEVPEGAWKRDGSGSRADNNTGGREKQIGNDNNQLRGMCDSIPFLIVKNMANIEIVCYNEIYSKKDNKK